MCMPLLSASPSLLCPQGSSCCCCCSCCHCCCCAVIVVAAAAVAIAPTLVCIHPSCLPLFAPLPPPAHVHHVSMSLPPLTLILPLIHSCSSPLIYACLCLLICTEYLHIRWCNVHYLVRLIWPSFGIIHAH